MKNNLILKLKLKLNWDFPQSYDPKGKSGIFVGREQEKERLVDIFLRKKGGSILLCGPRGVGKTALVYKALQEAKSQQKGIIPIILNVSQIEAETEDKLTHEDVLINLIRRLYATLKKEKGELLTEGMRNLYFKSVAKGWQLEKVFEEITEKETKEEDIEQATWIQIIKQIKRIDFLKILGVILFILTVFLAYNSKLIAAIASGVFSLGSFLFEDIKAIEIGVKIKQMFRKFKRKKDLAKETYLIDKNVGNLEYELSEALTYLSKKNKKVIFVVDELDKYASSPKQILDLIKTYKNLFSLSSALFIFITGTEIFEILFNVSKHPESLLKDEDREKIHPELYRTSFTEVFYLSRPNFNDISRFLDQILEEKELKEIAGNKDLFTTWEEFKHYLGFEARDDFFRLITFIKNFIKNYKSNKIFLEVSDEDFLNTQKAKARFHKALFLIYEKSSFRKPTEWIYNEELYEGLFEVLKVLESPNHQCSVIFSKKGDVKDAQKKLIDVLEKVGKEKMPAIQVIRRDENQIVYKWTGVIPEIGDTLEGPYPHEERFIKIFEELLNFSQNLSKVFGKVFSTEEELINWIQLISGISVGSRFNLFKETKTKIIEQNEHFNIEVITKYTEELENELQNLYKNILNIYVNSLSQLLTSAQKNKIDQNNLFSLLDNENREKIKNYNHLIIYKPNLSKQILIIENYPQDDLVQLNEWGKNFIFSYKIINIESDITRAIQSIKGIRVNDIVEWFNDTEIKLNVGGIDKARVISGIPSKERIERKVYLKLNKVEGITIDGKNPHTFLILDKEQTDFNVTIEVLLKDNGIFNFIFGFNENENKQMSFYMIRLDSREDYKNDLLQANYGGSWNPISQFGHTLTSSNTPHILEVSFKNNNLQVILDKNPIISHTFPSQIKGKIGFMNELEDVFLRRFQLK